MESEWQLLSLRAAPLCTTPTIRDWTVKINKTEVGRTRESGLKGLGENLLSSKKGKEKHSCTLGSGGGPVPREPRQACPRDIELLNNGDANISFMWTADQTLH